MAEKKQIEKQRSLENNPFNSDFKTVFERGLRFIHQMEVQGRLEQTQIAIETSALVDLLIAKGIISDREFGERKQLAAKLQEEREANRVYPLLGDPEDKYKVPSPDIPCQELIKICQAACCNLSFNLSTQDLDEGIVRWEYGAPYRIRRKPNSGKCHHWQNGTGCNVYQNRPSVCRSYDCRQDKRIWKDFENRIPSDEISNLSLTTVTKEI